ncbi:MAG: hypothetical protein AAGA83_03025 [Cyanobacteria bacterium P01_F01_bin.116]
MKAQIEEMHAETEAFSQQFNDWAAEQKRKKSQSWFVRLHGRLRRILVMLRIVAP